MIELFEHIWSPFLLVVLEVLTFWHSWVYARDRARAIMGVDYTPRRLFLEGLLGRFAICQISAAGFYVILGYLIEKLLENL